MKRGRGVGEKVCHGAVIAIYRTSWGTGPYIHPALIGVKEMGGKRWSEKKTNQGSRNKWPRTRKFSETLN